MIHELVGKRVPGQAEGPTGKVTGEVSEDRISGKLRAGLIGASFTGTRAWQALREPSRVRTGPHDAHHARGDRSQGYGPKETRVA